MTRAEIDILWQRAMQQAVKDGEMFTRHHFAALVAKNEREACAQVCDALWDQGVPGHANDCAAAIRARGDAK